MNTKSVTQQTQEKQLLTQGKPTPQEVAVCAYLIWEHEGRGDGYDVEHWLQAERQLQAMRSQE